VADTQPIILVADDEPATLKYLSMNLSTRGYRVVTASDGNEALRIFRRRVVDLAMLDLTMPGADGFEICRQIRSVSGIPIIIVTGRATESDVVAAFDAGADDYVTKPFGVKELLARVRSALRLAAGKTGPESEPVAYDDILIDYSARRVWKDDREITLTSTEYSLLSILARNADRVLTHRFILESVWGGSYSTEKEYVRAYIYRLRTKLSGDDGPSERIASVPGVGYMFRSEITTDSKKQPAGVSFQPSMR
jgi:two-component system KDP operon response regulator KdpE